MDNFPPLAALRRSACSPLVCSAGRTDDSKAVFTQNGVVAKVGDFLDDASSLNDIWTDGGVAINPYGPEVAFHGQTFTNDTVTDAVFVGQAPEAPPPANGDESSGE